MARPLRREAIAGRVEVPRVNLAQIIAEVEPILDRAVDVGHATAEAGASPVTKESGKGRGLRSEFSAASLHTAYPQETQAALLEGIEKGFEFHGGVFPVLRLDNLPLAVQKILKAGSRREHDRFIAFRSHYLFESSFTSPGVKGAHEKGGIEGEVGRFRRRWLTPVPEFQSWAEFNDYLRDCCSKDMDRTMARDTRTVASRFETEREFLKPLPLEAFELSEIAHLWVDNKARIQVKTCRYGPGRTRRSPGVGAGNAFGGHRHLGRRRGLPPRPSPPQELRAPRARSLPRGADRASRRVPRLAPAAPGAHAGALRPRP